MLKILLVDDDDSLCRLLTKYLTSKGYGTASCGRGEDALAKLKQEDFDLVLLDLRLPDGDGALFLQKIKILKPEMPVVMATGYSDVRMAVKTIKLGAFDYIAKPLHPDELLNVIKSALASKSPGEPAETKQRSNPSAPAHQQHQYVFGESDPSKRIKKLVELVSPTNMTVIIQGETGTGKEYVANLVHQYSKRKDKPFVAIDCGALSKELAGSELFGHEKGAFTGAVNQKTGSFEHASGGTLFLDEIGNLSYEIQVKLLRALQERKITRVGSNKDIGIDVRVIVATNENLQEASQRGHFREDLFHRLNEFSIEVPPLRERQEDIMVFGEFFLEMANKELGKNVEGFAPKAMEVLSSYPWPGNLREMKNTIKRAVLLCTEKCIDTRCLPHEVVYNEEDFFEKYLDSPQGNDLKASAAAAERKVIIDTLKAAAYNKTKAAKILNIDRKTLYNKMNEYKIDFNA